jgi:hypothetical protein
MRPLILCAKQWTAGNGTNARVPLVGVVSKDVPARTSSRAYTGNMLVCASRTPEEDPRRFPTRTPSCRRLGCAIVEAKGFLSLPLGIFFWDLRTLFCLSPFPRGTPRRAALSRCCDGRRLATLVGDGHETKGGRFRVCGVVVCCEREPGRWSR